MLQPHYMSFILTCRNCLICVMFYNLNAHVFHTMRIIYEWWSCPNSLWFVIVGLICAFQSCTIQILGIYNPWLKVRYRDKFVWHMIWTSTYLLYCIFDFQCLYPSLMIAKYCNDLQFGIKYGWLQIHTCYDCLVQGKCLK